MVIIHYSFCSFAQLTNKTWINRYSHDALILTDDNTFSIESGIFIKKTGTYCSANDTIEFVEKELFSNHTGIEIFTEKRHSYRVLSAVTDRIVLTRRYGTNFLGYEQDTIIFDDYNSLYDSSFTYRRIYFHTSSCYGLCPDFKIEIFSNGLVFFYGRLYTGKYKGTYKGFMNNSQQNELLYLLRSCNVRNFPRSTGIAIDAPERRLIIEYGNDSIDFCGDEPPYSASKLFLYLINNYKNFKLKKCVGCRAFIEKSCYEIEREQQKEFWDNLLKEEKEK